MTAPVVSPVWVATAPAAICGLGLGGFVVAGKSLAGKVHVSEEPGEPRPSRGRVRNAALVAVAACLVTLVAAEAGAGDGASLIAGSVVLAGVGLPLALRGRAIDGFALLVLVEIVASVVLLLISDNPQFVVARPAFYTAIAGIYAIITCWYGRPLMLVASRPMAAGGDPGRAAAFDRAWEVSAVFRRMERAMTLGLGVVLLLEAVLRVVVTFTQPVDAIGRTSVVSQLPALLLFVGYIAAIRVFAVPTVSREVDRLLAAPPASAVPGA